jgi:hypothetical protein
LIFSFCRRLDIYVKGPLAISLSLYLCVHLSYSTIISIHLTAHYHRVRIHGNGLTVITRVKRDLLQCQKRPTIEMDRHSHGDNARSRQLLRHTTCPVHGAALLFATCPARSILPPVSSHPALQAYYVYCVLWVFIVMEAMYFSMWYCVLWVFIVMGVHCHGSNVFYYVYCVSCVFMLWKQSAPRPALRI